MKKSDLLNLIINQNIRIAAIEGKLGLGGANTLPEVSKKFVALANQSMDAYPKLTRVNEEKDPGRFAGRTMEIYNWGGTPPVRIPPVSEGPGCPGCGEHACAGNPKWNPMKSGWCPKEKAP